MNTNKLFEDIKLTKEQEKEIEEYEKISNIILALIKQRINKNLTQRELAELTNIKQPMIARIESLNTIPRLDTLTKIASALKCDITIVEQENYDFKCIDFDTKKYTYSSYNSNNYYAVDKTSGYTGVGQCC